MKHTLTYQDLFLTPFAIADEKSSLDAVQLHKAHLLNNLKEKAELINLYNLYELEEYKGFIASMILEAYNFHEPGSINVQCIEAYQTMLKLSNKIANSTFKEKEIQLMEEMSAIFGHKSVINRYDDFFENLLY